LAIGFLWHGTDLSIALKGLFIEIDRIIRVIGKNKRRRMRNSRGILSEGRDGREEEAHCEIEKAGGGKSKGGAYAPPLCLPSGRR
jgi:hypothetical protein